MWRKCEEFASARCSPQGKAPKELGGADNPDEYAEIIEENFGIATNRGTLRPRPAMAGWGSIFLEFLDAIAVVAEPQSIANRTID